MKLQSPTDAATPGARVLRLPNDADVRHVALDQIDEIELNFPRFTDGRAYSQAIWLRQQRQWHGVLRATGEVLVDQLLAMQRCGFSHAQLAPGQSLQVGQRLLARPLPTYPRRTTDALAA